MNPLGRRGGRVDVPAAGAPELDGSGTAGPGTGSVEEVRREEELRTGVRPREAGRLRVSKSIESHPVEHEVARRIEHAVISRTGPLDDDPGGVIELGDGSISIPVVEEELVVTKHRVVKERIVIRKHAEIDRETIQATLRAERVDVDVPDALRERVHDDEPAPGRAASQESHQTT